MRNPLSLEAFADWCEKKPADEEYEWLSMNCAWGQYIQALGMDILDRPVGRFCGRADPFARKEPRTFHALAQRLRSAS